MCLCNTNFLQMCEGTVADPEGVEGAYALPKITLKCDNAQATLRNRSKSLELYIAQKWQTTF